MGLIIVFSIIALLCIGLGFLFGYFMREGEVNELTNSFYKISEMSDMAAKSYQTEIAQLKERAINEKNKNVEFYKQEIYKISTKADNLWQANQQLGKDCMRLRKELAKKR